MHAVNIAESAERLHRNRLLLAPEHELAEMARQARAMLSGALDAFVRGDARLGREICRQDDGVDALRNSVFRVLLTHMMEDPRSIGPAMQLFLVSRNLERVADLATNIAEGYRKRQYPNMFASKLADADADQLHSADKQHLALIVNRRVGGRLGAVPGVMNFRARDFIP